MPMIEWCVIPAIIPQSLTHLRENVARLGGEKARSAFSPREIQIDIVDGMFVSNKSWPYKETDPTSHIGMLADVLPDGMSYELDLMIANPLATLPVWLATHPRQIVLHIESFATDEDVMCAITMTHAARVGVILAALNDTPLERLFVFVPYLDGIQCMGIAEIGRQGNTFDARVLARIRELREKYSTLSINVDGSVNTETIPLLKVAGANRFVVGSGIFATDDPVGAYEELYKLVSMA